MLANLKNGLVWSLLFDNFSQELIIGKDLVLNALQKYYSTARYKGEAV